eukprot:scaffold4005_cov417-Prasinococcus_capsulatus_cf.AAC.2
MHGRVRRAPARGAHYLIRTVLIDPFLLQGVKHRLPDCGRGGVNAVHKAIHQAASGILRTNLGLDVRPLEVWS